MLRRYLPKAKKLHEPALLQGFWHDPYSPKRKRVPLAKLGTSTRVEIVKLTAAKKLTHKEIADRYNVRTQVVS